MSSQIDFFASAAARATRPKGLASTNGLPTFSDFFEEKVKSHVSQKRACEFWNRLSRPKIGTKIDF